MAELDEDNLMARKLALDLFAFDQGASAILHLFVNAAVASGMTAKTAVGIVRS